LPFFRALGSAAANRRIKTKPAIILSVTYARISTLPRTVLMLTRSPVLMFLSRESCSLISTAGYGYFSINGIIQTNPGIPFYQRVFAHATKTIGSGMTAAQGRVSFVTFLCPPKKSKRENVD